MEPRLKNGMVSNIFIFVFSFEYYALITVTSGTALFFAVLTGCFKSSGGNLYS